MEEKEEVNSCDPTAERYDRHLPLINGPEGQEKLSASRVAIVGLGGLGSVVSMYLAAAGVGELVIIDGDRVEESNLNRQLLYDTPSIGLPKPYIAAKRLKSINPCIEVRPKFTKILSLEDAASSIGEVDLVVDALDNWKTRLILDEYTKQKNIPLVHAAVERYYGQLMQIIPGKSPRLSTIAPKEERKGKLRVLGPVVGIVASIEALLSVKTLLGDYTYYNKLIVVDARSLQITHIELKA